MGLALASVAGCAGSEQCSKDADCATEGLCEPTGFCSFADEECPTGRRYRDEAPAGQAGACVLVGGTTTGVALPPTAGAVDDASSSGSSSSTGATSTGAESTDTGPVDPCTEVTVDKGLGHFGGGLYATEEIDPNLGNQAFGERFELRFNNALTGDFNLGQLQWASYATCPQCLTVVETGGRTFFATEGQISVDAASQPMEGTFSVQLADVVLSQVEIDPATLTTTIVDGGACLRLANTELESLVVDGWHCQTGAYVDSACHCGCGVLDPQCETAAADACEACDAPGACAKGLGCPTGISALDNSVCDPAGWDCALESFGAGDGVCDCGCGLIDPDCGPGGVELCDVCGAAGACGGIGCGAIDPNNIGTCD